MATVFDEISDHHAAWIARQPMFFVATAPLAGDGRVNVSPKGPAGALRVLGPMVVCYVDVGGSGGGGGVGRSPPPRGAAAAPRRSPICGSTAGSS